MKRWTVWLGRGLIALALIGALAPAPARAGVQWGIAEQALFIDGNVGCSKDWDSDCDSTLCYLLIPCTDGQVGKFQLTGIVFPPDSGSSWTYRVHYEETSGNPGVVCAWDIKAAANPSGAATQQGSNTASADSAATTHSAFTRYVTQASAATVVTNNVNSTNCTGSPSNCINTEVTLTVALDSTTTTGSCSFRALEINYN